MTKTLTAVLTLAFTLAAGTGSVALAQESIEDLRAHCSRLEQLQTPGVVDCWQAVSDMENAASDSEAQDVLRSYFETSSPYDFQRVLTTAGESGATMFDDE